MDKAARTIREDASHPLQSPAWGEFRAAMGVDVAHIDDWIITFHKIPFTPALPGHTPWTIGYFPKGPAITKRMIDELTTLGKQKNAIFIQLEPNVICHCEDPDAAVGGRGNLMFDNAYQQEIASLIARNDKIIKPSHHPLFTKYTFVLDLTKSEEELQAAMYPKTRYNIKVAQKHGVQVKEDNSDEAFNAYLALTRETTNRQGFYAHNETYHRTMWNIMKKAGIAHLFTATYQGNVLAAWICFVWKDTIYYPYGASSREHRSVMAPNLMLWEIVKWAKQKKFKKFDLWGAMGLNPDPNDPFYGFHRFKEGFAPQLVEFIGSYDLVIHPLLYKAYTLTDTLRWTVLKLKMKL